MTQLVAIYRTLELPWTAAAEQERSFRRTLKISVAAVVVAAFVLSLLPLPRQDRQEVKPVPQRFARLILEKPKPPPPPPPPKEEPKPKLEPKPEPAKPEPKPQPKPKPERRVEQPKPPPPKPDAAERARQARAEASGAGLLPFAEQLAALRDDAAVGHLDTKQRVGLSTASAARVTERALVTSKVGRGSGGISTSGLSRNIGGTTLAGRETTRVESPIEGVAPGGGGTVEHAANSGRPSRSREEIERVFDKNKGAIYALYNRALRQNPALQGKVVLRLTIAPDGRVTACEIVSSELGDADLEKKLVERVRLFRFEAKDVDSITTTKPIDFFPA